MACFSSGWAASCSRRWHAQATARFANYMPTAQRRGGARFQWEWDRSTEVASRHINRRSTPEPIRWSQFGILPYERIATASFQSKPGDGGSSNPPRPTRLNCPGFSGGCILWEDVAHGSIEAADAEARIGTPTSS